MALTRAPPVGRNRHPHSGPHHGLLLVALAMQLFVNGLTDLGSLQNKVMNAFLLSNPSCKASITCTCERHRDKGKRVLRYISGYACIAAGLLVVSCLLFPGFHYSSLVSVFSRSIALAARLLKKLKSNASRLAGKQPARVLSRNQSRKYGLIRVNSAWGFRNTTVVDGLVT